MACDGGRGFWKPDYFTPRLLLTSLPQLVQMRVRQNANNNHLTFSGYVLYVCLRFSCLLS